MKFAIYTLGCKVNQYETQAMEAELLRRGHVLTAFEGEADVYLINTCTVTAAGDRKSRWAIRRAKQRNRAAVVGVCGCYAQTDPKGVKELGVDLISGTGGHMAFLDRAEELAHCRREERGGISTDLTDCALERRQFELLPAGGLAQRTRAMMKVEDGCVNFCSYCIIPYARGPVRSMPLAQAVTQAALLAREGYGEVVLTGIELSSWGQDFVEKPSLAELVEGVAKAAPSLRIRLGSLEPRTVTQEFSKRMATLSNLCPHFHLSLQSGCDAVLARMNRRYDTQGYRESVALLRQYFDQPAITTDVIVGFPGESEEEFEQTLAFVREMAFSALHIFPYSRRADTPAAAMEGQCLQGVKEERANRARVVAEELERAYLAAHVGKTVEVLFENPRNNQWLGHTKNYLEVALTGGENLHNCVKTVALTGVQGCRLTGELV